MILLSLGLVPLGPHSLSIMALRASVTESSALILVDLIPGSPFWVMV